MTPDQIEQHLRASHEQLKRIHQQLALKRVDEEFRITRFEVIAGIVVVLFMVIASHAQPWSWF